MSVQQVMFAEGEAGWADLDDTTCYRYTLGRRWDADLPLAVWCMLNPSTADAHHDDHTIKRCRYFSRREGCGGFVVVNLFALRATQPAELLEVDDPRGPENDEYLDRWLVHDQGDDRLRIAAWGSSCPQPIAYPPPIVPGGWLCLGTTQAGHPRHPSRLGNAATLEPFRT